jgi:hypothetical protein
MGVAQEHLGLLSLKDRVPTTIKEAKAAYMSELKDHNFTAELTALNKWFKLCKTYNEFREIHKSAPDYSVVKVKAFKMMYKLL